MAVVHPDPTVELRLLPVRALRALLAGDLARTGRLVGAEMPAFFATEGWLWGGACGLQSAAWSHLTSARDRLTAACAGPARPARPTSRTAHTASATATRFLRPVMTAS